MKIIIVLLLSITSLYCAPVSDVIPQPDEISGGFTRINNRVLYTASYDSAFGGHWEVTEGVIHYSRALHHWTWEYIRGTVSDSTINGTFTENDFMWLADWYRLWDPSEDKFAVSFSITISNGFFNGKVIYYPQ